MDFFLIVLKRGALRFSLCLTFESHEWKPGLHAKVINMQKLRIVCYEYDSLNGDGEYTRECCLEYKTSCRFDKNAIAQVEIYCAHSNQK